MKTFLAILAVLATLRAAEGIKCYHCAYMNVPGFPVSDHDYCSTATGSPTDYPDSGSCMYGAIRNGSGFLLGYGRSVANATSVLIESTGLSVSISLPSKGCTSAPSTDPTYKGMGLTLEVCVCTTDGCTAPSHAASMACGFHQLLALAAAISITIKTLF